ncbi:hypothetical protein HDA40_000806 [Hamadaea flava]|uniref:Uncharacterized protein n=1 Tax=Hamadaea flava TaxID=1742688 RepID=A0ABV8LS43_9ACTN|nr:hypothetical protein [Hamadaea flava]MCP2322299.1 hypothetical protein [Hamadaea flava]
MPKRLIAAAVALTTLLLGAHPASAAVAGTTAVPRAGFDIWFNVQGASPKVELGPGWHNASLWADCASDVVNTRLMHVTWGLDRPVGDLVVLSCQGEGKDLQYHLSGGEYYFGFLSGVDNTHISGDLG